jgi:hypothetical protein
MIKGEIRHDEWGNPSWLGGKSVINSKRALCTQNSMTAWLLHQNFVLHQITRTPYQRHWNHVVRFKFCSKLDGKIERW